MQIFLLLASLVVTQVLGDIWLSRGMKAFGEANPLSFSGLATLLIYLLTNPWIWVGVGTLIGSLFLYFIAVSRLDLSYVLPIHASNYVLNALLAWLILGETVSFIRWASAFIITFGVFIVSFSEDIDSFANFPQKSRDKISKWLDRFWYFQMPITITANKTWLAIVIIVLADAGGDLFNAIGMRKIGAGKLSSISDVLKLVRKILTSSYILRGIACQTVAFISFVSVLSWADISLVRPATALTYVFTLLGARFVLNEQIKPGRLIGITIVGLGVALVAFD